MDTLGRMRKLGFRKWYERQLIESALKKAGGVQKQAADLLGLKATTLNEKIKRLGIPVH